MSLFDFFFGKQENPRKLKHLDSVRVNIIDQDENYTRDWFLGKDISTETYERFVDPETSELYVVMHYKDNQPVSKFVSKNTWDTVRLSMMG